MQREPSKQEAIRLAKAGFNDVLHNQVRACTAPLFWYEPNAPLGERIRANGTIFFIRFADNVIGITADHVYTGFLDAASENPRVRSAIFNQDFDMQSRLIARSSELDIATFDVPTVSVPTFGGADAHRPIEWPPPTPTENRGVIFVGYPGDFREEAGQNLFWTPYSVFTVSAVVAPDRIMVQFDRSYLIDPLNRGLPPENLWLGGLSGCPLFALWESKATGVVHIELSGVGVEFNEALEIARFAPISVVGINGSVDANAAA